MGSFQEDYKICHEFGKRIYPEQMEIVHQIGKINSCVVSPSGKYIASKHNDTNKEVVQHEICVACTEELSSDSVKLLEPFDEPHRGTKPMFNPTEEYLAVLVSGHDFDRGMAYIKWINIYKIPNFELYNRITCQSGGDDELETINDIHWIGDYSLMKVQYGDVKVWSIISGMEEIVNENQDESYKEYGSYAVATDPDSGRKLLISIYSDWHEKEVYLRKQPIKEERFNTTGKSFSFDGKPTDIELDSEVFLPGLTTIETHIEGRIFVVDYKRKMLELDLNLNKLREIVIPNLLPKTIKEDRGLFLSSTGVANDGLFLIKGVFSFSIWDPKSRLLITSYEDRSLNYVFAAFNVLWPQGSRPAIVLSTAGMESLRIKRF